MKTELQQWNNLIISWSISDEIKIFRHLTLSTPSHAVPSSAGILLLIHFPLDSLQYIFAQTLVVTDSMWKKYIFNDIKVFTENAHIYRSCNYIMWIKTKHTRQWPTWSKALHCSSRFFSFPGINLGRAFPDSFGLLYKHLNSLWLQLKLIES